MTKHNKDSPEVDFGYEKVSTQEKNAKVAEVFHEVAAQYDRTNDALSLGLHRKWKNLTVLRARIERTHRVLDLAGGTGDLTHRIHPKLHTTGQVVLCDINASMLRSAQKRFLNAGTLPEISIIQANAEQLPFASHYFNRIIIAFGLRNITDKKAALREMYRCLQPGGCLLVLEFSQPSCAALRALYDYYSFKLLPKIGQYFTNSKESYTYLAESIRMHPNQKALATLMESCGFEEVKYHNLSGGIVALHTGYKY